MKKLVSLFLTATLSAGALTCCAGIDGGVQGISVGIASSDAAKYGS